MKPNRHQQILIWGFREIVGKTNMAEKEVSVSSILNKSPRYTMNMATAVTQQVLGRFFMMWLKLRPKVLETIRL